MSDTRRKLKIGLDYHGVINDNPAYFQKFCTVAIDRGHELHILTGGPKSKVERQLADAEILYSALFTMVDMYAAQGKVKYYPDGHFEVDENLWNTAKADYCRQNHIDVQIDDSLIYGQYFSTPYCLSNSGDKNCTLSLNGFEIDLHTMPPSAAVRALEKYLA